MLAILAHPPPRALNALRPMGANAHQQRTSRTRRYRAGKTQSQSPSASPGRKSSRQQAAAAAPPAALRVLLHSHSWAHCDGVAIRYKAHSRQLIAQGHRVALVLSEEETDDSAGFVDASLSLSYCSRAPCSDGPMIPMCCAANLLAALRFVVQEQPDIIHVTFDSQSVAWVLAARLCNVPLVVSYHTDLTAFMQRHSVPWALRSATNFAEGSVGALADKCFTVSNTYRRKVEQSRSLHSDNFHETVWGPMVNHQVFRPDALGPTEMKALRRKLTHGYKGADAFLMVYAGRISTEKGEAPPAAAHMQPCMLQVPPL